MGFWNTPAKKDETSEQLSGAVLRTSAVIWFSPEGEVLDANDNFCRVMGYERDEIIGNKHALFLDPSYAKSEAYHSFWSRLKKGESFSDTFLRIGKGNRRVWIEASYVPISDEHGKVIKILKFATDVTARLQESHESKRQLEALDQSQATIEFLLDGTIVSANDNFLHAVGYTLDELRGKHHSIFIDDAYKQSPEYRKFWADLARGEAQSGEFRRFGKGGREVWMQASYNPILDADGTPVKVIKFASDITEYKQRSLDLESQISALDRSQAVIEFDPDGTVRTANSNFLNALGYELGEIVGKHHRIFVAPEEVSSPDYNAFWEALRAGEYQQAEYRRIGKGGKEVWIQATYNPIMNPDGQVYKVVKFATDITPAKNAILAFQQVMSRLAQNDLGVRLTQDVPLEFATLKEEFNSSVVALGAVISGISERADVMMAEVTQIASAATDLSQRTEKQAAALEETSTALEEMTASVSEAAKAAAQADQTSISATERTDSGLETVQKAVEAMKAIETSSNSISKITGLIDDIAFQTNLLALNAGVEAARAGESGRGFAVVASEVRQLAQRSSEAAKEISDLIGRTAKEIDGGVKLVDDSGTALAEIAEFVKEIRERVRNMTSSAQEQSVGLDEINTAMNQLDQATQQNAAMFEETSAATQSLEKEAGMLTDSTKQFSFSEEHTRRSAKRQPEFKSPPTVVKAEFKRNDRPEAMMEAHPPKRGVAAVSGGRVSPRAPETANDDDWDEF